VTPGRWAGAGRGGPMTRLRLTILCLAAADGLVTDVAALGTDEVAVHSPLCVGHVVGAPWHGDSLNPGTGWLPIGGERHGTTTR
jgi:hypothetical protein